MEHYAPHPKPAFEGYYSKFHLPSGAHLALIICSVPNADKHPPHMVSLIYYPKYGAPIFHREHWVSNIYRITTDSKTKAFELRVAGMGFMRCDADSTTTYELECEEWSLRAKTKGRVPWYETQSGSTPEGWIVRLPLPLHWHVHSLASPAEFDLDIKNSSYENLAIEDRKGEALIHQEKNWANSFPSAHIWIQAYSADTKSSVCLAGGKILGMTAYLLGYRSRGLNVGFRPPFSLAVSVFSLFSISPIMTTKIDWQNREFALSVAGLWKKIEVKASARKDRGWFGLASPFADGHRSNFLTESFLAEIEVKVWERGWSWFWGGWKEVKRERFEGGSLEFGGEYFPERGGKRD